MLSNEKSFICFLMAGTCLSLLTSTAKAAIGCPPMHNGKPLANVGLFDGDPVNKIETIPEPGRFVVPFRPPSDWDRFPQSTLGCTYRGSKDMVVVVLPRSVRVCEFPHYPHVDCH